MDSESDEFSDAREHMLEEDALSDKFDLPPGISEAHSSPTADEPAGSSFEANESKFDSDVKADDARLKAESLLTESELQERQSSAQVIKEKGNMLFRNSAFGDALEEYSKALDVCPIKYESERAVLFSNRAACYIKLGDADAALLDCDKALSLDPKYVRCLQRRAGLREEKDRLSDALADYQSLLQLDPGNEKARWACMTLPERIQKQQEEMKEKMLGQLKQLGNMVLKPFGLSTDNFKVQKNPDSEGYSINFVR